jgi:hypothetical protein
VANIFMGSGTKEVMGFVERDVIPLFAEREG